MSRPRWFGAAGLAVGVGLASTGCALRKPAEERLPALRIEHGSFRIQAPVDIHGSILLTERVQLLGHIDAAPIFASEGTTAESVQVLLHDGCYWITAEGFGNVWRVEPQMGTPRATYRAIPLPDPAAGPVRLSRWGGSDRTCVRLDAERGGPWFVRSTGEIVDACG